MRIPARLLLVASLAWGCAPAPSGPPPIVLISIDTLRSDHLSCYGYWRPTPHIDALAREGVRFDEAHATAPWTLPSHMSLLTGLFPAQHGVEEESQVLDPGVGLLAEALSRAGYRTAGFAANDYLSGAYGFSRGFDTYEVVPYRGNDLPLAEAVVRRALRWLRRLEADRPFFLFVHLMDPHYPYDAPPPFAGRYSAEYQGRIDGSPNSIVANLRSRMARADLEHLIDLYDEEIAYVDAQVGRLLGAVRGRPDGERSVVVLTSDHGEEFKEHGSLGHALTLYREQSHVPLILSDPASPYRGRQVSAPVRLVDVAPTIAEIARLEPTDPFVAGLVGIPLSRHLAAPLPAPLPVIVETSRWGPKRTAVSLAGRKAISPMTYRWWLGRGNGGSWSRPWLKGLEIYDIDADPAETRVREVSAGDGALAELTEWRERTWRGVRLALRLAPGWEGEVRLDSPLRWVDEPSLEDGRRLYAVKVEGGRIALSGLPDRPLVLWLPVDPARAGALELRATHGELFLYAGEAWQGIAPGTSSRIELAGLRADAAPPDAIPEGSSAVLRVRPLVRGGELVIDEQTRDRLEDLGYGR